MRAAVVCLLLISLMPVLLTPAPLRAQAFSDEAVEKAIARGVKFLWSKQGRSGDWGRVHGYPVGPTALVCYALLESGVNPQDPRLARALDWLAHQKTVKTYSLALRCQVWAAANRTTQGKYRVFLAADAKTLWSAAPAGAYDYNCDKRIRTRWDNSNSQFGLLGVWAASEDIVEAPLQYWNTVWNHWKQHQFDDGTWGYTAARNSSRATMTVGGIASLFICFDHVFAAHFVKCTGGQYHAPIQKGLDWLDRNFARTMRGRPDYYYYYGVERTALASGYKYFGQIDWYKQGATNLLRSQKPNGAWPASWGSELASASFAVLYLIRGRNAVVFNKLEYDGYWNNRPRDLANLTRWMSRTFERTVNWQIINLKVPVTEWHDAPILYIAGSKAPTFNSADLAKLREFVLQGGAIFSVAECDEKGFRDGIRRTYKTLFPQYALRECPRDHVIYTREAHFDLPAGRPKLHIVSNGVRPLAIHTAEDLSLAWRHRKSSTQTYTFQVAANIAKYVTGNITTLRPRGTTHWPGEPNVRPKRTVQLVRVRHAANWDPEPLAYVRFARLLAKETGIRLKVLAPTTIRALPKSTAAIATITGTGEVKMYDSDLLALKQFVESGGTLVVDAAGGDRAFAKSALGAMKRVFPDKRFRPLASNFPLFQAGGRTLDRVRYRFRTDVRLGRIRVANLKAVLLEGRPAILFSAEDITAGLVGYPSGTVDGYEPRSAYEILRNIVVYAGKRARTPENPIDAESGLRFVYYDDRFSPQYSGTTETFNLGADWRGGQFALKYMGFVDVPRRGTYTFSTVSDDATKFYLGDQEIIRATSGETKSEALELHAGKHAITVTVFQAKGGVLRVLWEGPGLKKQDIPAKALHHVRPKE